MSALTIVAPAAPGGGWDQTARVMQQVLARIEPDSSVQVENVPGAAGTIGLSRFVSAERGNPDALLVTGLVMLSAIITNHAPVTLADATPIARLTGEYEVIVVPAASKWQTLGALVDAFKAAPASISWGGGSAGGTDDLLVRLIAAAVGVPPSQVNYIAFAGGGAALAALLGDQVTAGVSGYAEFAGQIQAGTLRVLAVSAPSRIPGFDAPTLREQGIALDLANWRGVLAPPGLTDSEREQLTARVQRMATSAEWKAVLVRNAWADLLLTGAPFRQFLLAEHNRIEQVLRSLASQSVAATSVTRLRLTPMTFPSVALGGLALLLVTIVARRSRHRPHDVRRPTTRQTQTDQTHRTHLPTRPKCQHARTREPYLLALVLLAHALLMPWIGFVPASAVLFVVAARLLGSRRPGRDAVIGVTHVRAALRHFHAWSRRRPPDRSPHPFADALMDPLLHGFAVALTPVHLWWALVGATLGTAVGVLPGIGPALTVALLLPVTFNLEPTAALIMFAGIYYGAMYGGSTTSILLNTPGESATMVTAIEGHEMAKSGRAGAALSTAAIGSFVAGTLSTLALSLAAPTLVRLALVFGPAEYFALMVLAFVMVCSMLGPSLLRGFASLFIGLTLGVVGIDSLSGEARLTFGIPYLLDGIDVVIVAVGLFAVGEALTVLAHGDRRRRTAAGRTTHLDDARGVVTIVETMATRHGDWISAWRAAGRWCGAADAPLIRGREASLVSPRGIRPRRHRGCGRAGGRQ